MRTERTKPQGTSLGDNFMQKPWLLLSMLWNCTCVGLKAIKHLLCISCSDLFFRFASLAARIKSLWQPGSHGSLKHWLEGPRNYTGCLAAEYGVKYSPPRKGTIIKKNKTTTSATSKLRKVWRWVKSRICCHHCQGEAGSPDRVLVSYQPCLAPVAPPAPTGCWGISEGDTWAQ